jgi:U6 snRNA-associated Sm-like protein LSm1
MLVVLRDGRKLHGVLRSYDQFGENSPSYIVNFSLKSYQANLVLEDTVERIYHGNAFAENWHGLFLIRGENVVLLGEIVHSFYILAEWYLIIMQDLDQEDDIPLRQLDYNVLEGYHKNDAEAKKRREEVKAQVLYEQKGFCKEGGEGDGY